MPDAPPPSPRHPEGSAPAEFDAVATDYDAQLNRGLRLSGEPKEFFAQERVGWTKRLAGDGPSGGRVLDFGCGTGTALPMLHAAFGAREVWGFDPSEASLAEARRLHGARLPLQLAASMDGLRDQIDLAYCNGVFHHIPPADRPAALGSIYRALVPGAGFALWENNPWNPMTRLSMRLVPFDRDAILLWPAGTRKLLRSAGFEVLRTDYRFFFPRLVGFLRPLEPLLRRCVLGAQYVVWARKPGPGREPPQPQSASSPS